MKADRGKLKQPIHLLGRDECERELGFSYATASDVPFEQLQATARELYALRKFRTAYDELQRLARQSKPAPRKRKVK